VKRVLRRITILTSLVVAGVSAATLSCGTFDRPAGDAGSDESPRVLSTVPPFTLQDQAGGAFGLDELAGRVWVANFIFTRCPGTCPVQTRYVKRLQEELRDVPAWSEVRLVSFTVDPQYDTPDVLQDYAVSVGADPDQWFFLTGTREEIWQLSKDGFKLPVGDAPPGGDGPILHATQLMLIDDRGRLRGYYDGLSDDGLQELRRDLGLVLGEN
jgi:cytochrome oxidase Cu insertion factor (SCO1/SenC/PrrC family)